MTDPAAWVEKLPTDHKIPESMTRPKSLRDWQTGLFFPRSTRIALPVKMPMARGKAVTQSLRSGWLRLR